MSQSDSTDVEAANRDLDPSELDEVSGGFQKHVTLPDVVEETDIVKHTSIP